MKQESAMEALDALVKAYSQELYETRKKEETLLASIPGGVAIYRMKKNGKVATDYVSEGFARMCGYEADEFLEYMREDSLINLAPEDVKHYMEIAKRALDNKESINAMYHIYNKRKEKILIRFDANIMAGEELSEDEIAVVYAVHTRVSEDSRKMIEERNRYRVLLENLDISFFEWENTGESYYSEKYNKYALSKVPIEDIIENRVSLDMIHPDDVHEISHFLKQKQKYEPKATATLRLTMKDGTYRWTEMLGFFEYDSDKKITKAMGVLRDVNSEWQVQNRRLQEALGAAKAANRAKTDFLSRVSHDMRTPLNGILGTTALLEDYVTDRKVKEDLIQLETSGRYLLNLINDTLDVSRIESGRLELNPTVCDGRTVFNNILSLISPNLKEKKINLKIKADNLPFTVLYLDVGRVEQIIMNLLGNAVKFTPVGGEIVFTMENVSVENGVITDRVTIEDNGIGISANFLPHLFEPFTQENNTTTSSAQGTGLGMTITKQIIELMGGEIEVESEVGKGTKVTLILPMPIATPGQIEESRNVQKTELVGHALEGKRILLCEDHPLNAKIAVRMLENKGIRIEHAEDGRQGVEMFEASQSGYYDAILMDIRMPVMNGIDATAAIRSMDRPDAMQIPIIAMTANAFAEDIEETKKAGMNAHLSKPVEPEKLYRTLEELLNVNQKKMRARILVVDDVELNRVVIRESVGEDYEILEASNGEEALAMLEEIKGIDAVITDIHMPGIDGIELIRRIKSNPDYRQLVILANTQYGEPDQEEYLLEIGANDFVYKPTTPKILETRLHNVLKKV